MDVSPELIAGIAADQQAIVKELLTECDAPPERLTLVSWFVFHESIHYDPKTVEEITKAAVASVVDHSDGGYRAFGHTGPEAENWQRKIEGLSGSDSNYVLGEDGVYHCVPSSS